MKYDKWIKHWMLEALDASLLSKDPSVKCGAVIVRPNNTLVSTGFNGFPQGMKDNQNHLNNRDSKLNRTVHAEMNALNFAREDITGCTMYVWPSFTCDRCAVHIMQRGISKVVGTDDGMGDRWAKAFLDAELFYYNALPRVEYDKIAMHNIRKWIDERTTIYQELRR